MVLVYSCRACPLHVSSSPGGARGPPEALNVHGFGISVDGRIQTPIMSNLPPSVYLAVERLRAYSQRWDDTAPTAEPVWQLLQSFGDFRPRSPAHERLALLVFFCIRVAIPDRYWHSETDLKRRRPGGHWVEVDWRFPGESDQPKSGVDAIRWLHERVRASQSIPGFIEATLVEDAVRFTADADIQIALEILLDVDNELDEMGMAFQADLKNWFLDVAIPAAWARRELRAEERECVWKSTSE